MTDVHYFYFYILSFYYGDEKCTMRIRGDKLWTDAIKATITYLEQKGMIEFRDATIELLDCYRGHTFMIRDCATTTARAELYAVSKKLKLKYCYSLLRDT